jgi:hypothetical protein
VCVTKRVSDRETERVSDRETERVRAMKSIKHMTRINTNTSSDRGMRIKG